MTKIMKRICSILIAAVAALALIAAPLNVHAIEEGTYVIDKAGALSDEQLSQLNEQAKEISSQYECGVYIIVTSDYEGSSEDNYVRDLYKNNELGYGEGKAGVLLGIDINDRYVDMCAYGAASDVFPVSKIKDILSDAKQSFANDDWYGGFLTYLSEAEDVIANDGYSYYVPTYTDNPSPATNTTQLTTKEYLQENPGIYFLCATALGAVLAFAITMIMRSRLKNIGIRHSAAGYIKENGVQLTGRYDYYLGTTVSRVHIQRDHGNSGGGYHDSGFSGGGGSTGSHF